jgi:hypothetical protein
VRWLTVRQARAAFVLAVIVLPWVAAPRGGEAPNARRSPSAADSTAIESRSTVEVVTADRPTVSPHAKRGDGVRLPSVQPLAGPGAEHPGSFAWPVSRSGSIGWSAPIALHLAERGPPSGLDT